MNDVAVESEPWFINNGHPGALKIFGSRLCLKFVTQNRQSVNTWLRFVLPYNFGKNCRTGQGESGKGKGEKGEKGKGERGSELQLNH